MLRIRLAGVDYLVTSASIFDAARRGESSEPRMEPRAFVRQAVHDGHASELAALVFPDGEVPVWFGRGELIDAVVREIEAGRLTIVAQDSARARGTSARSLPSAPPDEPSDKPDPDDAPPQITTWFELRLVDEIGAPISGVKIAMRPGGTVATGGDGVAHVDVPHQASGGGEVVSLDDLRAAVTPRWDTIRPQPWLQRQPGHTVVALDADASTSTYLSPERRHTLVIEPWVVRAQLEGLVFDTNKSFLLPEAVSSDSGTPPIDRLREWFDACPETVALVVGHTDPSGDAWYNDPLSLERAEAFVAYLQRDVDHWASWYTHSASEKRWGAHEDRLMLDAVGDRLGLADGWERTRAFQAHAGLDDDGFIGPDTRRALIEAYMDLQDTTTATPRELRAHGCGENFPKLDKPDVPGVEGLVVDPDSDDQRRVEVFLFPADTGIQPPPPGSNSGPDSPEYPEWVRRSRHTEDLMKAKPKLARLTVRVRGRDEQAGQPIHGAEVRLTGPETDELTRFVLTDTGGLARFEKLTPGRYRVRGDKPGYSDDERIITVETSGVTPEQDAQPSPDPSPAPSPEQTSQLVSHANDPAPAPTPDPAPADADTSDDVVDLELGPTYMMVSFTGKAQPAETNKPSQDKGEDFVFFEQGDEIILHWTIKSIGRPTHFELHRRKRTDDLQDVDYVDTDLELKPAGPGVWTGSKKLDLRDRIDGELNELYAPPLADGVYRLKMREQFIHDEAEVRVAGVAFFGALVVKKKGPADETKVSEELVHGESGSFFEHPHESWDSDLHGTSAPGHEVTLMWTLVGLDQAGMQLEILGAEPEPHPHYPDDDWPLDMMSLVREASEITDHATGKGQGEFAIDTLTLRANINVFRKGAHDDFLGIAHWDSTDRLGGSVLLIAEDRRPHTEGFTPIDPMLEGPGYYQAFLPHPSTKSRDTEITRAQAHYCGRGTTVEIIERVGAIWAATHGDRRFGLGEIFAPGHESHFTGVGWDVFTLREDAIREHRDPARSPSFWSLESKDEPDEDIVADVALPTSCRDAPEPKDTTHFDPVGMEELIMLFIDVMALCKGSRINFQQIIYDDKKLTASVRSRRKVAIGIETEMMRWRRDEKTGKMFQKLQGTHGWHVHFLLSIQEKK